ncbi:unnamed protein product [Rotaria socialis]|uniref:Uncharacterized protein n=1 Tax=Rotaria socialis TaxID=392032 RepID=A0A821PNY1_9BILA|nr:unnamed protein product [Rotaria socialis]
MLLYLDEDIDCSTLVLLQQNDVCEIFPRMKDRVKFIDQRLKLVSSCNSPSENNTCATDLFHSTSSLSQGVDESQENDSPNSSFVHGNKQADNVHETALSDSSSNLYTSVNDDISPQPKLPLDYEGPHITSRMKQFIEDQNLSKFSAHTKLRSELLSLLFDDVTNQYQLIYPSNNEYLAMAKAIDGWHESIKQKFKRERRPLQSINNIVRIKQDKYGNGKTGGRQKRKSMIEQAERRIDDIPIINLADQENASLLSMVDQMKNELDKDYPDNNLLRHLWIQSFNTRRLCYHRPEMILAEVKECAGIDMEENVNELLPKLFDCLPDNNYSLSDALPIRIIRILCKLFGDPVANIFTYGDPLVPYPCMKIHDDKFALYLDFCLITETTSCSIALALLISFYYVFETAEPIIEQTEQEQHASSDLNSPGSTDTENQPSNDQNDDNLSVATNSKNEKRCNHLTNAYPPPKPQRNSSVMLQKEITSSIFLQTASNNNCSRQTIINQIDQSSLKQPCSIKQNTFAESEEHHPHAKRKRKQPESSSSSTTTTTTTTKNSARLLAKRARID